METKILNYRVIIEPEKYPDGSQTYNAYCPTLGVADYGDTVEEAMESIKEGILLAIECLAKEKREVPVDNLNEQIVAAARIVIPSKLKIAIV